ncbi:uncharacterized protein [Fopius arisanus]|uniref:Uncharacterized protein n=1 Tax=Fopius arisanus TaxID=64838 RepID=A0A9R1TIL6_9HYME|nr:PREDICTED: uncharacterized protein LOC105271413 [Fopius arisanus]
MMKNSKDMIPSQPPRTALEILGDYPDVLKHHREAINVDELMLIVRKSLNSHNLKKSSLCDDEGPLKAGRGRLSMSLIKASEKRKRTDDDDEGEVEMLRKIGVPKKRRSFGFPGSKFVDPAEYFSDERPGVIEDPTGVPDPVSPPRNSSDGEKLIVTPAKARRFSISSEIEFDRVYESIQTQGNISLQGVQMFDNFDVINDILDDKVMASLLEDMRPQKEFQSLGREEINGEHVDGVKDREDYKSGEDKNEDSLEGKSPRRRSSRLKTSDIQEFLNIDDTQVQVLLDDSKDETLSPDVIHKLRTITVKLEEPVLPQHTVEKGTIRRCPNAKEKLQFKVYSNLKEGRFSLEENNILKNNWKRFCEVHKLDIPQTHFFKCKYQGRMYIEDPQERRKFVQFLAQGLPSRTLRSVYVRFKVIFGAEKEMKSKSYTEEDDEKIMKYMQSDLPLRKSQVLSKLLNRPYKSIYQRYLQLMKRGSRKTVFWSLDLMEVFLKNLIDVTISEDVWELKDAIIPKAIWVKLEEIMKIDFNALKNFWYMQLHPQLFFPRRIYFNELKIMLIEFLYVRGVTHITEIDWGRVSNCFDGLTKQFLVNLCPRVTKTGRAASLGDLIEKLYEEKIQVLKGVNEDFCLPRVRWHGGKLEVVDNF